MARQLRQMLAALPQVLFAVTLSLVTLWSASAEHIPPELHGPIIPPQPGQLPLNPSTGQPMSGPVTQRLAPEKLIYANTEVGPPPRIGDGLMRSAAQNPPAGYIRVRGVATTYEHPSESNRRYMLRGIQIELWQDGLLYDTQLKTVYSVEPTTDDGTYGLSKSAYVQGGTWYHQSDDQSGYFDFGNVYVGSGGADVFMRMVFIFHSGGNGSSSSGSERLVVHDDNVLIGWDIPYCQSSTFHVASGQDTGLLLMGAPALGSSGLNDEAAHVYYDCVKSFGYFRDATGYYHAKVDAYVDLGDSGSPFTTSSNPYRIDYNEWTTGYLTYTRTCSIAHEYAHSIMGGMYGGSLPPLAPGDTNHGGEQNSNSTDALIEGWARFVPVVLQSPIGSGIDSLYRWGASSGTVDVDDNCIWWDGGWQDTDREEWNYGGILFDLWDDIGSGTGYHRSWMDRISDTHSYHEPSLVSAFHDAFIGDWGSPSTVWNIFNLHNVNYDTTQPSKPSISSSSHPSQSTWYSKDDPQFAWAASDSLSGLAGYYYELDDSTPDYWTSSTGTVLSNVADGEHDLYVRARDNAGNLGETASYHIRVDTTAPDTASVSSSTHPDQGRWYDDNDPQFSWSSSDSRSGIEGYYVELDDSTPDEWNTSTNRNYSNVGDGVHQFWVQAVDQAGNRSSARSYQIKVDTKPPSAPSISSSTHPLQSTWYPNDDPQFSWSSTDAASGVKGYYCELDDPSPDDYTTSTTRSYSSLPDGEHTLYVKAVDNVDHRSSVASYTVRIDTGAPTAPVLSSPTHPDPDQWYGNNDPEVHFSSSDSKSGLKGYYVGLDDPTPDDWTTGSSRTFNDVPDGEHTVYVRAEDEAGNRSSVSPYSIKIDTTGPPPPPVSSPTHPDAGKWYSDDDPEFSWESGSGEIKGYYCALDDREPSEWTTSTSAALTNVPDGTHRFYVQAEDEAGNRSAVGSCVVKIDTGGPDAPAISSSTHPDPATWYLNPNPQFAWTATSDLYSGIDHYEARLDEQHWENVGEVQEMSYANVPAGRHTFMVRAADGAGNLGSPGTFAFNVDIGRPEVTITAPAEGSVVHDASVLIRGTASDDTGLEKVIVRVNGGDWVRAEGAADWSAWATMKPATANLVEACARDIDGHWGTIVGITLNGAANLRPVTRFTSPADGATVCDACVLLQGAAIDDVSLQKVIVRVNGGPWEQASGTSNWSAAVELDPNAASVVEACAQDSSGQFGPTATITLNSVGNLRPVAMFTSPPDGSAAHDAAVLVQGTAVDDVGLDKVIVRVNGGPWVRADGTTDWSAWMTVSSGPNVFEAIARDIDGQWGPTGTMTLTGADNLRPVAMFTSPPDGSTVYDAAVLVQGTAVDDVGLDKVIVRVNGGVWKRATGTTNWSAVVDVVPGVNMVEVQARDTSGQWGPIMSRRLIATPSLRPVAAITTPSDGSDTSDAQVTVAGTATDDGTVVKVIVRVNGGTWVRATGTTDWSETVSLAPGTNLIEVRAYDDVGLWGPIGRVTVIQGSGSVAVSGLVAAASPIGAEMVFTLSASGYVTAEVMNIAGRPIRTLVSDRLMSCGLNELCWDGRSNEGLSVPSGTYLVRLSARSATGTESQAMTTLQLVR